METPAEYRTALVEAGIRWRCERCQETLNLVGPHGTSPRWGFYRVTAKGVLVIACPWCGYWNVYRREEESGPEQ